MSLYSISSESYELFWAHNMQSSGTSTRASMTFLLFWFSLWVLCEGQGGERWRERETEEEGGWWRTKGERGRFLSAGIQWSVERAKITWWSLNPHYETSTMEVHENAKYIDTTVIKSTKVGCLRLLELQVHCTKRTQYVHNSTHFWRLWCRSKPTYLSSFAPRVHS